MGLARRTIGGERLEWRRIRQHWVLRDAQTARLLGLETRALNQWLARRTDLFPPDFSFQLEPEEWLRSYAELDFTARGNSLRPPRVLTAAGLLQARLQRESHDQLNFLRWLAGALPLLAAIGPTPIPWLIPPPPRGSTLGVGGTP